MLVELVKSATEDGVRLDGALSLPAAGMTPNAHTPNAVLLLHGAGSNFYSSSLLEEIAERLNGIGIAVLRANTRGNGALSLSATNEGRRKQGAAYETVDECRFDVAAWCSFLRGRGYQRIAVAGHSLGALKSLYAAAQKSELSPACVIAVSPPRLSFAAFKNSPASSLFFDCLARAEELVAAGRPQELIEVRFPLPLLISAGGYVDKYGRGERYNYLKFLDRVTCPVFFLFGQQELDQGFAAFAGSPEAIAQLPAGPFPRSVVIVPGAEHFYRGLEEDAAEAITLWLTTNGS